jgi:tetratricopeptide (TPR) repeat protein
VRIAAIAAVALTTLAVAADPPGSPRANEALALCERADDTRDEQAKRELLARGLTAAEEAVAADERDPVAHFAVFCNLGKETEMRGVSIGSLVALRRIRREIDRTVELAPDWSDALVGKGSLLLGMPGFVGGDRDEAERLLRAAVRIDPDFITAHLALARALEARHAREEARAEARRALEVAERDGNGKKAAEAKELLGRLAGE